MLAVEQYYTAIKMLFLNQLQKSVFYSRIAKQYQGILLFCYLFTKINLCLQCYCILIKEFIRYIFPHACLPKENSLQWKHSDVFSVSPLVI